MLHTLVNDKKFAELPKHYQAALETACGDANQWMMAKYDAVNPAALKRLIAARNFNRGCDTLEYISSALVDLELHQLALPPHLHFDAVQLHLPAQPYFADV